MSLFLVEIFRNVAVKAELVALACAKK